MRPRKRKRIVALLAVGFLLLFYHIAFFPYVLEAALKSSVHRFTEARLELSVRRAGLVFGFVFDKVRLSDRKTNQPIFEAKSVRLKLALHSLLIGHVGLRELGLYDARVNLVETDGRWNYEALTGKPGAEVAKPAEDSGPLPEVISVYLPIKLYANLILHNFSFYQEAGPPRQRKIVRVENVNFRLAVITKTFRSIPLSADAVSLFDTLMIGLNPHSPIRVHFDGQPAVQGDLKLTYLLYRDEGREGPEFVTRLHVDTSALKIGRRGSIHLPVGLAIDYDTIYQSNRDRLLIRKLSVRHHSSEWLSLSARIEQAATPQRKLSLEVTGSQIRLGPLHRLLSVATGGRVPYFQGTVALAPLRIEGSLERLTLSGTITGNGIVYRSKGLPESRINGLSLRFTSDMDLYRALPFLKRPENYDAVGSLAFGVLHNLRVSALHANYNGAAVFANARVLPSGLTAFLKLARFRIDDWGYNYAWGFLDGTCTYGSNIRFTAQKFDCRLQASDTRYLVGRSRSGRNQITLNTKGTIRSVGGGSRIDLNSVDLRMRDEDENPTLDLRGALLMAFGGGQTYDLRLDAMSLDYDRLKPTLPGSLQHSLLASEFYLRNSPKLTTRTFTRITANGTTLRTDTELLPGFMPGEKIRVTADMDFGKKSMVVRKLDVKGLSGALSVFAKGKLLKLPDDSWDPDLVFNFAYKSERPLELYQGTLLSGVMKADADIKQGRAIGRLDLEGLNVEQRLGNCANLQSAECVRYLANGIEMKLPIDHRLRVTNPPRLTDGSDYYLTGGPQAGRANFRVRFVASSHNPRGEFVPHSHFYIGGLSPDLTDGLVANLSYRNNILRVAGLEIQSYRPMVGPNKSISWKKQGGIYGKRIFFNVADLNPDRMEYSAFLQIKDLDLEPFLPKSRSGYDGIVSADLEVVGHSVTDPLLNTDLRLSVYRLSPEFSGFVTRLVMPGPIAETIVNRTLEIPSIKVQLAGGLVYSSIAIRREAVGLGLLIRPGSDEIKQERIPLALFLANARSEARR